MGQIQISVDLLNATERNALKAFIAVLDGELKTSDYQTYPITQAAAPETKEEPAQESEKPKRQRAVKAETEQKEEVKTEPNQAPEEPATEAKEQTAVTEIELRKMVSEAVQRNADNRNAIKAKFTEIGISNLAGLSEENYNDFHSFLITLK